MKFVKLSTWLIGFATLLLIVPSKTSAQWGLGASYELRNEDPENGFGVRIERSILNKVPIVDLALRAHFSFFNEDNTVQFTEGNQDFIVEQEITDYDIGITAVGGIPIGIVKPYVGIGLGSNTVDLEFSDVQNVTGPTDENNTKIFWNGLVGAEVSIIPALRPFVEYRFTQLSDDPIDQQMFPSPSDSNDRVIFGIILRF